MGRAPCCSKVGLKRGPWTIKEDSILIEYMEKHGEGQWRSLPKKAGLLRCGKSCRLRWMNYLRPDIKRGNITPEEEELIIKLHKMLGNRWSLIAGRLPGRTDNEIKNYWNTHLRKRIEKHEFGTNTVGNSKNSIKRNNKNPNRNKKMSEAIEDAAKNKMHVPKPTRFTVPRPINSFTLNQVAERFEMKEDKLDSTWARFDEEKLLLGEIDNDQMNYQTMIGIDSDKFEKLYSEYLLLLDGEEKGDYASVPCLMI